MNIVVLDSSTLILLAKINMLKMVYNYYNKAIISENVFKESVETGKKQNKEDAFIVEREVKEKRIIISKIKNTKIMNIILKEFKLDMGEAEALALAIDKKTTLFTDDYEAMKVCKVYEVDFITALAFLIKLVEDGKLEKEEALIKFDSLSKLGYYSKEILNYSLMECNRKWNK